MEDSSRARLLFPRELHESSFHFDVRPLVVSQHPPSLRLRESLIGPSRSDSDLFLPNGMPMATELVRPALQECLTPRVLVTKSDLVV
jgi:hypothetical protein